MVLFNFHSVSFLLTTVFIPTYFLSLNRVYFFLLLKRELQIA